MKIPFGVSFLLAGSGLYWILSSQLISSFTVLTPNIFKSLPIGKTLILIAGIISTSLGLWIIDKDIGTFCNIIEPKAGLVFVLPLVFVALDLYSTVLSLSIGGGIMELNPFVSSAIEFGSAALVPFIISYMLLSQGLALLMVELGRRLFGDSSSVRILPFALGCGASSYGPVSNLLGIGLGYQNVAIYGLAVLGSAVLSIAVYEIGRDTMALRLTSLQ